jgi:PhnB protein
LSGATLLEDDAMQLNTYLNFDGDCEAAFNYYSRHLGGKIVVLMKYADGPMAERTPPEARDKVMHARYEVDGFSLMGTDCTAEHPYRPINCAYVLVNLDDAAKAERVFTALADGGKVEMPLQETFWAHRYGVARDRFGVPWMVNCERAA